jgi:hypothetical protein
MTYGQLPAVLIHDALGAYNDAAIRHSGEARCELAELANWIEIHHILTNPYLGHHGYSWHPLRSW